MEHPALRRCYGAALAAGYVDADAGELLRREGAALDEWAARELTPCGADVDEAFRRALTPPHRQLGGDPLAGYYAVDRHQYRDDAGRVRVTAYLNGPDAEVLGFLKDLSRGVRGRYWHPLDSAVAPRGESFVPPLRDPDRTAYVVMRETFGGRTVAWVESAARQALDDGMTDLVVLSGGVLGEGAEEPGPSSRPAAARRRAAWVGESLRSFARKAGLDIHLVPSNAVTPARAGEAPTLHVLADRRYPAGHEWVTYNRSGSTRQPLTPTQDRAASAYPDARYRNTVAEQLSPFRALYDPEPTAPAEVRRQVKEEWATAVKAHEGAVRGLLLQGTLPCAPLKKAVQRLWDKLAEHHGTEAAARAFFPDEETGGCARARLRDLLAQRPHETVHTGLLDAFAHAVHANEASPYTLTKLLRDHPELDAHGLPRGDRQALPDAFSSDRERFERRGFVPSGRPVEHMRWLFQAGRLLGLTEDDLLALREGVAGWSGNALAETVRAAHDAGVRDENDPDLSTVDAAGFYDWAHASLGLPLRDTSQLDADQRDLLVRPHHLLYEKLLDREVRWERAPGENGDLQRLDGGMERDAFRTLDADADVREAYVRQLDAGRTPGVLAAATDRIHHLALHLLSTDHKLYAPRFDHGGEGQGVGRDDEMLLGLVRDGLEEYLAGRRAVPMTVTGLEDLGALIANRLPLDTLMEAARELIDAGGLQQQLPVHMAMARSAVAAQPRLPGGTLVWTPVTHREVGDLKQGKRFRLPPFHEYTVRPERVAELVLERDEPRGAWVLEVENSEARDISAFAHEPAHGQAFTGEWAEFTSPVYLHTSGRLAFALHPVRKVLDQLPDGHLIYLNPSAPVSMTVETDALREALDALDQPQGGSGDEAAEEEGSGKVPAVVGQGIPVLGEAGARKSGAAEKAKATKSPEKAKLESKAQAAEDGQAPGD
ncbi:hypothetical protein ABZY93_23365 [Streptomyces smyrnaeus]|uniref:hypothetical protein n=1 Tax=Streptomyces smyrnaeus TaxID=1387713 RepID=UPI0033BC889E